MASERIEGEYYYAELNEKHSAWEIICKGDPDELVACERGRENVVYWLAAFDTQARHHREAALRQVDEAAEALQKRESSFEAYPRHDEWVIDTTTDRHVGDTFTAALLSDPNGKGGDDE